MWKTICLVVAWVVLFFLGIDVACSLLTAASTIGNVIGIFLLVLIIYLSMKTKCLTEFNRKK